MTAPVSPLIPATRPLAAAVTMTAAMLVIGLIDNFVAMMSERMGLWQFHAMRSTLMLPLLVLMSWAGLGTLWPRRWRAVLGRSLALGGAMLLYFGALGFLSVAEALAGLFTSPIFVLLITALGLRQKVGPWRILAVALGFAGILLVLQPGGERLDPVLAMPVAAGALYAVSAIATRTWCEGESTMALLAASMVVLGAMGAAGVAVIALIGSGESSGFLTRGWVWPVWDLMPLLILQAVGSLAGVFLIIRAYQMDEASYVAVFEYAIMIFAPAFSWFLFGQVLGVWQAVGIGLIVAAGVLLLLRARTTRG